MSRFQAGTTYAAITLSRVAPRGVVEWGVRSATWLETYLSRRGRSALAEAQIAMNVQGLQGRRLATEWLASGIMDVVDFRRLARDPNELSRWKIEHVGFEPVLREVEANRGLVVCMGHFGSAGLATALARPGTSATIVTNPTSGSVLDLKSALLEASKLSRLGPVEVLERGGQSELRRLVARVAKAGHVAMIAIDAPFVGNSKPLVRPFVGFMEREFDPGPARLARVAQVPLVLCVPERIGPRRYRLHWGPVQQPVSREREDLDSVVLSSQLDLLERHVGRLRHQFPYPIGWQRRWDSQTGEWLNIPATPRGRAAGRGSSVAPRPMPNHANRDR